MRDKRNPTSVQTALAEIQRVISEMRDLARTRHCLPCEGKLGLMTFALIGASLFIVLSGCKVTAVHLENCNNPSICAHEYADKLRHDGIDTVIVVSDWEMEIDSKRTFKNYVIYKFRGSYYIAHFFLERELTPNDSFMSLRVLKKYKGKTDCILQDHKQFFGLLRLAVHSEHLEPCVYGDSGYQGIYITIYAVDGKKTYNIQSRDFEECPNEVRTKSFVNLVRYLRLKPIDCTN